jgi:hypothetical protein
MLLRINNLRNNSSNLFSSKFLISNLSYRIFLFCNQLVLTLECINQTCSNNLTKRCSNNIQINLSICSSLHLNRPCSNNNPSLLRCSTYRINQQTTSSNNSSSTTWLSHLTCSSLVSIRMEPLVQMIKP